jgi:hypothetical protein
MKWVRRLGCPEQLQRFPLEWRSRMRPLADHFSEGADCSEGRESAGVMTAVRIGNNVEEIRLVIRYLFEDAPLAWP